MATNYETKHKKYQVSLPRRHITLYNHPIHDFSVFLTIQDIGCEFIVFGSIKVRTQNRNI